MRVLTRGAILALAVAAVSGAAHAQPASVRDDARCRDWGAERGTQAYYDCRATLDRRRHERWREHEDSNAYGAPPPAPYGGPYRDGYGAPPLGPATRPAAGISDGDAIAQCERRARYGAPFPIDQLAAKFVAPGREKRVTLSFRVVKPGPAYGFWNVECRFAGDQMTSFKGS